MYSRTEEDPGRKAVTLFCTTVLLIDLEGTLIDTAASAERSWRQVTGELGLPFGPVSDLINGIPASEAIGRAFPDLPPEAQADLAGRVQAEQAGASVKVTWMPGARDFVLRVPTDRWAVVTSSDLRLASASMAKAGVPTPLVLVTAEDVLKGAPAPNPFLTAGRALRVPDPSQCVAVGDSPADIESAHAAGMRVLAVAATVDAKKLERADWVVPDLRSVRVTAIPEGLLVEATSPSGKARKLRLAVA